MPPGMSAGRMAKASQTVTERRSPSGSMESMQVQFGDTRIELSRPLPGRPDLIVVRDGAGRLAILGDGSPVLDPEQYAATMRQQDRLMRAGQCPNGCGPLSDFSGRDVTVTRSTRCRACGFIGSHGFDVPIAKGAPRND